MEIDVSKCAFYNNGKCNNPNGMACNCCNNAYCYYKELQQLKTDNEELCTAIRNGLSEQYDKRVSEAEGDIAWGVLDRNATEAEFCKHVIYETRNYIAKLEQENEKLKEKYKLAEPLFQACKIKDLKIDKYKQCLDEIEDLINKIDTSMGCAYGDYDCENCSDLKEEIVCSYKLKNLILQLIKQRKNYDNSTASNRRIAKDRK